MPGGAPPAPGQAPTHPPLCNPPARRRRRGCRSVAACAPAAGAQARRHQRCEARHADWVGSTGQRALQYRRRCATGFNRGPPPTLHATALPAPPAWHRRSPGRAGAAHGGRRVPPLPPLPGTQAAAGRLGTAGRAQENPPPAASGMSANGERQGTFVWWDESRRCARRSRLHKLAKCASMPARLPTRRGPPFWSSNPPASSAGRAPQTARPAPCRPKAGKFRRVRQGPRRQKRRS